MKLVEHFFSLIAPYDCLGCGREGTLLCLSCSSHSLEGLPERCYRCYRLQPASATCAVCRHHSVLKRVWICTDYNEMARTIVHKLKFSYAKGASKLIARELSRRLPSVMDENTIIIHVPAATSHVRQRGFDQSALIARGLSKLTGLQHITGLARIGQQRQVGASGQTRKQQLAGVFRPISLHMLQDAHVILVDDVLTTGSTLESAALALRRAGAKTVDGLVFAQAK